MCPGTVRTCRAGCARGVHVLLGFKEEHAERVSSIMRVPVAERFVTPCLPRVSVTAARAVASHFESRELALAPWPFTRFLRIYLSMTGATRRTYEQR